MAKENEIGLTGRFPDGKLFPSDKGELAIGIGMDPVRRLIFIKFGTAVTFLGLEPEQAIGIADDLINKANELMEANNETKRT